jgi:hypothetical protein
VTADDVVFSIERIFDPRGDTGLAGQYLGVIEGALAYHQKKTPRLTGVVALGRHTVRIRLAQPSGSFLWSMAMVQVGLVPRDVVERVGDAEFGRHPIGCGPFRFVSSDTSQTLLVAYEGYFRGRANLDSLVFTTPRTNATALGPDMRQGRVDMAEIPATAARRWPGRRPAPDQPPQLSLSFVGMNCDLPPRTTGTCGARWPWPPTAEPCWPPIPGSRAATGVLPPGMSCYSPEIKLLPHNVVTARAGWPRPAIRQGAEGDRLLLLPQFVPLRKSDSLLVAGWRRGAADQGAVQRLERTFGGVDRGTLPLFSLSWVADIPDPDSFLGASSPRAALQLLRIATPKWTRLGQGRVLVDPRTRGGIIRRSRSTC